MSGLVRVWLLELHAGDEEEELDPSGLTPDIGSMGLATSRGEGWHESHVRGL